MIDVYEAAKQRISMAENVTEKFTEIRNNIKKNISKVKYLNMSEEARMKKRSRQREHEKEFRKTPEYKRKHAEYMRAWRQKNDNYRDRNKLRMRLRRKKLKELAWGRQIQIN